MPVVSGLLCVLLGSLVGATVAVAAGSHAVIYFDLPPLRRVASPPAPRCATVALRATVSRAAFDTWLAGSAQMAARTSRIVPWIVNGRAAGFKIYAIPPGSPLALIGLKNGDVVRKTRGIDVRYLYGTSTSPLRGDAGGEIHVDLLRRGCPMSLIVAVL